MPCLLGIVGVIFPRIVILVLYFLTDWFNGVFDTVLYPLLGFIIAPVSLLWYSIVIKYFGGQWDIITIVGMVIAVIIDLGGLDTSRRRSSSWW